ncbi:putative 1-phosphatidylinositol 4-kinase [Helianthus annuus]|nr:putative 1-phosphatidylinositol 4-kinase [Helianthus annuus]KAJ0784796.1 putative 1-phosphatidylinositol 4-kinase [Helianthus annuus]KAJ0794062.1 putative 1-phosphatidylinositol 4-kinase [Helianthus annuus]KAJ0958680.1 putative 1-phosphatidylinositol 4-kinase [Helianthus annuus]
MIGVCFPMGKRMYLVVHIPEDEANLLNSREKTPYLMCVKVLKSETVSIVKEGSTSQKPSRGGIPLANGDAFFTKTSSMGLSVVKRARSLPFWSRHDDAIDQAMGQLWDSIAKFVNVRLVVNDSSPCCSNNFEGSNSGFGPHHFQGREGSNCRPDGSDLEWVRVVLTADSMVRMDEIEVQEPPRMREHCRVPSTIAFEDVKFFLLSSLVNES